MQESSRAIPSSHSIHVGAFIQTLIMDKQSTNRATADNPASSFTYKHTPRYLTIRTGRTFVGRPIAYPIYLEHAWTRTRVRGEFKVQEWDTTSSVW